MSQDEPSTNGHGRARSALEVWLPAAVEAPGPIVEAARMLADEIDDDASNSPLWGRYWRALAALETLALASAPDWRETQLELRSTQAVEGYRARRYRAAESDEERGHWERMVPIGCARGDHHWIERAPFTTCADCDTVAGYDQAGA